MAVAAGRLFDSHIRITRSRFAILYFPPPPTPPSTPKPQPRTYSNPSDIFFFDGRDLELNKYAREYKGRETTARQRDRERERKGRKRNISSLASMAFPLNSTPAIETKVTEDNSCYRRFLHRGTRHHACAACSRDLHTVGPYSDAFR